MLKKLKDAYFGIIEYDYDKLKKHLVFYLILIIVPILIVSYVLGIWQIYFYDDGNSFIVGIIFTVLNGFVFGGELNAIGFFNKGTKDKRIKYFLIIIVIFLFITGLGFLDFTIYINLPFLIYKYFSLSSEHGILFIALNSVLFWIIYFASFTLEKDN